ncbi:putative Lysosomal acid phosphatase [Operophtera brumata]|uniref:Putative Lysosomal acid phosphatase n=1 Tax=Operophtera brumata TaxID=104452 RepID=A0A0L7LG73_OPEBR|nr:putative Lysosomal acid phosphatase [Operophtera brumata]
MYKELKAEKDADPKFTELFDYLSKQTNQSMRSVLPVDFLYSTFLAQQDAGLKLPEWTKNVFPHRMREPHTNVDRSLLVYSGHDVTVVALWRALGFTELLEPEYGAIHHDVTAVALWRALGFTELLEPEYGAIHHDVTAIALWRALGFMELLEPEYGASIVLELHEDVERDDLFVKVTVALWRALGFTELLEPEYGAIYHDVTAVALWRALGFTELLEPEYGASIVLELHEDLPFCDEPCPYQQFVAYISKLIPRDWTAECRN